MSTRYDLTRDELAAHLTGEPRYRVDQVWKGLYEQLATPAELTSLPKALRARLDDELPFALTEEVHRVSDGGDTVKYLWRLHDGSRIETVLMLYPDRVTVCVSSQAGCAMGCGFCATGQAGFTRHLTVGEIVEQVARASREARSMGRRLANVVFMGMGEPMANEQHVWGAIERIHGDLGLSARHLTISTIGIVPGIRTLSGRPLPVNLAVSLHAANDDLRDRADPDEQALPARCADGRVLRLPAGEGPADQLRVGAHRRAERSRSRRRRTGAAVSALPPARAREPDPAEPHTRAGPRRAAARHACASSVSCSTTAA